MNEQQNLKGIQFNRNSLRITRWLACVLGITLLSGCWKTVSFEEEVQLQDGRVIRIERSDDLGTDCPEMRCGSKLNSALIRISSSSSIWKYRLQPIILDELDGVLSIIAAPISATDHDEEFRSWPQYVQFNLTPKGWERGCLNQKFVGHRANLLLGIDWHRGEPKPITIAEKEMRNGLVGVLPQRKVVLPKFVSLPCKTPD